MAAVGGTSVPGRMKAKASTSSKRSSTTRTKKERKTAEPHREPALAGAKKISGPEGSASKGKKAASTSKTPTGNVKSISNKSDNTTTKKKKKKVKRKSRSVSTDSKPNALFEYTSGVVPQSRKDPILDVGFSKKNKLLYTQTASSVSDKSNLDVQTDTYSSTSDENLPADDIQHKFRKTFQSMKNFTAGVDELMKNRNTPVEIQGIKKIIQKPISISGIFKGKTDSSASNPSNEKKLPSITSRKTDLKSDSKDNQLHKATGKVNEKKLKSEVGVLPQHNLPLGDKRDDILKIPLEKKQSDDMKNDPLSRVSSEFRPSRFMRKYSLQDEPKLSVEKKNRPTETKPIEVEARKTALSKSLEVNPSDKAGNRAPPLRPSAVIPPSLVKMMTPSSSEEDVDTATVDLSMMRQAILETEAMLAKCGSTPSTRKTGFHKTEKTGWGPKSYDKIKPRPSVLKDKTSKNK